MVLVSDIVGSENWCLMVVVSVLIVIIVLMNLLLFVFGIIGLVLIVYSYIVNIDCIVLICLVNWCS